ncbi:hypothetical protein BX285_7216 [Streptomyces sp. 1114.5]|uniref:hypothetical protein n=1 Tax=Streptomyces sp. 1114.5 TaxID=1938830 RepID=UPI000EAEE2C4|nr:hypothetical protein [Streptomyces sp. 1114.5]RKT08848.1 hypothetical protein BX285_7216 [Streptomyces sp. 1114.5]
MASAAHSAALRLRRAGDRVAFAGTLARQHGSTAARQHGSTAARQRGSAAAAVPRLLVGGGAAAVGAAVAA